MIEHTSDGKTSFTLGHIPIKIFDGPNAEDVIVDWCGQVVNGRIVGFRGVDEYGEAVVTGWACIVSEPGSSTSFGPDLDDMLWLIGFNGCLSLDPGGVVLTEGFNDRSYR